MHPSSIFRVLNSRLNLVALKTPKNAQIFVRGPARPHARPHAPAAQNLKNGKYLGYTAPHSRPATGKPTRPVAAPKQLSLNGPVSGGSTTHNYPIPAPAIGLTPATRSGIPLGSALQRWCSSGTHKCIWVDIAPVQVPVEHADAPTAPFSSSNSLPDARWGTILHRG